MKLVFLEPGEKMTISKLRGIVFQLETEEGTTENNITHRGYISESAKQDLVSDVTFDGLIDIVSEDKSIFTKEPESPMQFSGIRFDGRNLAAIIE